MAVIVPLGWNPNDVVGGQVGVSDSTTWQTAVVPSTPEVEPGADPYDSGYHFFSSVAKSVATRTGSLSTSAKIGAGAAILLILALVAWLILKKK